jgi:hypothetical protein
MKKAPLISRFSEIPTVLDMESAVVARYALSSGADFLCLGAVSDAAGDEIDFDLDAITDSNGVVRIRKVLSAVMREPRLVRSFYSSWKRSSLAARNLGNVLVKLLELHAARSEGSSLWCTSKEGGGG